MLRLGTDGQDDYPEEEPGRGASLILRLGEVLPLRSHDPRGLQVLYSLSSEYISLYLTMSF